ncbi:MAG: pilus assembly PilX N-terminal domain-containing protein [Candidatus Pacebacteria bacterium]|nr:pilus assembly PilX N-terminal domain-containing protein [Candidatus Paceibacterota bacterium]
MDKQRGSALFFVVVILAVMTSALLALVTLSVSQLKGMMALSDSVIAFCAADTGIEKSMYRLIKSSSWTPAVNELIYPDNVSPPTCPSAMWFTFGVDNSVAYQVCVDSASNLIFRAAGNYKPTNTKRKLEVNLN